VRPHALPLITHARADAVIAWRDQRPITAAAFVDAARTLAARLPAGAHVLNLCADRYHFALATAAALLGGRCTLLPPTQAPAVIEQLQAMAPDMICLADGDSAQGLLARLRCPVLRLPIDADAPGERQPGARPWAVPHIPATQRAALIFTSGSTGAPVPHEKTFGALVRSVRAESARLPAAIRRGCAVLGTVPPQHMFGLESTVLLPLQSAGALCAERPFFPADIAAALQRLPRPRLLCTTPVHLRALLQAGTALPALDLILCATAPLEQELARAAEHRYGAPLLEIYGSTETGQIASRHTAREPAWRLLARVRVTLAGQQFRAHGGHVPQPTPLADVLEPLDQRRFLLHGRTADLVNIAGKRSSLAYLSHQLNAIPGVHDGAYFIREPTSGAAGGVPRLAAFAVAPQLDAARIIAALRERIDPVFLPRPLLLVERLPRNDTGKLSQDTLQQLATQLAASAPELFA
jgi:acyl-coenzyme A synthetase/AMP-(fatty) acid ligase